MVDNLLGPVFESKLAEQLLDVAKKVVWLESQGFDISVFENRIGRGDIRAIAEGSILPQVWLKLGNRRRLLKAVSALPREIQLELVKGTDAEVDERVTAHFANAG